MAMIVNETHIISPSANGGLFLLSTPTCQACLLVELTEKFLFCHSQNPEVIQNNEFRNRVNM